jgi:hypothetical protein
MVEQLEKNQQGVEERVQKKGYTSHRLPGLPPMCPLLMIFGSDYFPPCNCKAKIVRGKGRVATAASQQAWVVLQGRSPAPG